MSTNEHKLGLPIEYQQMPEYFDAHNINEQTKAKNALIKRLLKEQNVQTVLDMTCGTGSQVFYLSNHGFAIIGSDFSPVLLDIARAKAKEMDRNITFIDGDMRTVKIGKFDAIITILALPELPGKLRWQIMMSKVYWGWHGFKVIKEDQYHQKEKLLGRVVENWMENPSTTEYFEQLGKAHAKKSVLTSALLPSNNS